MTIHIKPLWDEVQGALKVELATYKGLGNIAAGDREAFEAALREALPPSESIVISYESLPKIIPAAQRRPAPDAVPA